MNTRTDYWRAIAKTRAELQQRYPDGSVYVSPVTGPAPKAIEVSCDNASRLLVEGTHRLSTDAEIAEFEAAQCLAASAIRPVSSLADARALFAALNGSKPR
jgi:hypothetical protein